MTPPPVETAVVDSFEPTLEGGTSQIGLFLILLLLTIGGIYVAGELTSDLSDVRSLFESGRSFCSDLRC
jgi:hypothetical protein